MLPERTSTKLTDTHKNNKRNLCNWVSLYPSLSSPLSPDYLNKASLFGGQKLLGELMFFGRERMLLWSLSRSCQHHRCCSSAYLLLLWSHTQHGHNTQYTHPHTHTWYTLLPHTSYYCQAKPNKTWFIKWQHSLQFVSYQLEKEQWPMHDKPSGKKRKSARERGIQRRVEEQQD